VERDFVERLHKIKIAYDQVSSEVNFNVFIIKLKEIKRWN
jgi:intergrase/recombinase